ncbi:MAG TPA: hypothetical protein VM537_21400 [Anaerolineae bacterium]|nr:hypothetical protein [Anaerolineae bacterium]
MIRIKPGVDLSNLQPQMLLAILVVASIYREEFKSDLTITSGRDGKHRHVLHYVGQAVDFRTRDLILSDQERIEGLATAALGDQYDAIHEINPDHLHVEFDPR